ncbi:MAG: ankyrin repeat domain-containing protein [Desulfatibacillum sp.]|nr:ankyrin repeat domain-containing protein [Desulfatibacillum sp.]
MKCCRIMFVILLLASWLPVVSLSDTIVFKDGRNIEVEQAWEEGILVKCIRFGGEISYSKSKVERIESSEKAAALAPAQTAAKPLAVSNTNLISRSSQTGSYKGGLGNSLPSLAPLDSSGQDGDETDESQSRALSDTNKTATQDLPPIHAKTTAPCSRKHFEPLHLFIRRTAPDAIRTNVEKFESGVFKAAYDGDLEQVKANVNADHSSVRHVNSFGETPLHIAATMCHLDVAKFLLDNGADVNAGSDYGYTPIMGTVLIPDIVKHNLKKGEKYTLDHEGMITFLLSRGADINALKHEYDPCDNGFDPACSPPRHSIIGRTTHGTPLMMAKTRKMAEFLVTKGADVNAQNLNGDNKFHYVCASFPRQHTQKSGEWLDYWLKQGADTAIKNQWGETPYECGARYLRREAIEKALKELGRPVPYIPTHYEEILDLIYMTCDDRATNRRDKNPGDLKKIRELVARTPKVVFDTDDKYGTLLHQAANTKNPGAVELFLEYGADPNAQDAWGDTPLHEARAGEIAQILLDYGADPNIVNCKGKTALQENGSIVMEVSTWRKGLPALEARLAEKAKERGPVQ